MKPSCPGLLFAESVFYYIFSFVSSDQSVQIICFFLIQLWWAGCISLESCPFLLVCQICWHIIVHSILLWFFFFFCISAVSAEISLFHFLVCLFGFFSLSSLWVWPEVCQFCYPFKEPALGFIDIFLLFFWFSILLISSDLYDFFPSANFRFCLFFF